MKNKVLILIVATFFLSCSEDSTTPEKNVFTVSGYLMYDDKPLSSATISLDEKINYTTTSESDGSFKIADVPKGEYNLKIEKTFDNGSFLSKSTNLEVNDDVILDQFKLPLGVFLYDATNIIYSQATITWSATEANDFREYKLFRNLTSGLDENTGTLVHVSTSINDTTYIDNSLDPLTEYYYRVYLMNDYGKLGGSNIIKLTTENTSLILNGDFEEIGQDSLPTFWNFRSNEEIFKVISDGQAHSGKNYLLINPMKYVYDLSWGSLQYCVSYNNLLPSTEYILSFWYYVEDLVGKSTLFVEFNPEQEIFLWDSITNEQEGQWLKYERKFTVPADISEDYYLRFEVQVNIPYNQESYKIRIDDVSLNKVD